MTVHLRFNGTVINYNAVEEWKIAPMRSLFGGHAGYSLHVHYSSSTGADSWDRIAINDSKEVLEELLTKTLDRVTELENSGGGTVTIRP